MLKQLVQLFNSHPYIVSAVGTWLFNNVVTVMVSSLPAPTKDSSIRYVYWFKVLNSVTGNLKRAQSTRLEDSPNWNDAVNAHVQQLSSSGLLAPSLPKPPTAP